MKPLNLEDSIVRLNKVMRTDYSAHEEDVTGLLTPLYTLWCQMHPGANPRADYLKWKAAENKSFGNLWIELALIIVTAIFLMIAAVAQKNRLWLAGAFACLAILVFTTALVVWAKGWKDVPAPEIWNAYHRDLSELLEAFPFLEDEQVRRSEEILRDVRRDIGMRSTQVAAKQSAGFVVDAKGEKDELLRIHSIAWSKFGIVRDIGEYFPEKKA